MKKTKVVNESVGSSPTFGTDKKAVFSLKTALFELGGKNRQVLSPKTKQFPLSVDMPKEHLPSTYKKPKLKDYNGDLTKNWYIDWQIYNTTTETFERKRCYLMNKYSTLPERVKSAKKYFLEIDNLLKGGATISQESQVNEEDGINLHTCTFVQAMEFAKLQKYKERLSPERERDYTTHLKVLYEWLKDTGKEKILFKNVTVNFISRFFDYLIEVRDVENKTFNNYRTDLFALYKTLHKRSDFEVTNIIEQIDKRDYASGKNHVAFSEEDHEKVMNFIRKKKDDQLLLAVGLIYYCFMRPIEVIRMKRKHIQDNVIVIPGRRNAKVNKNHYRQIPKKLEEIIKASKVRNLKDEEFIIWSHFTKKDKPVGKTFLWERHNQVLKKINLHNKGYDLYGHKHTGNIALYKARKNIRLNQLQNGHSNPEMTKVYLRDLGIVLEDDLMDF